MSGGPGSTADGRSSGAPRVPRDEGALEAAGAEIIAEPYDTDYGSHDFSAADPEGNRWSFGTYRGEPRKAG
jgi:hypothetical protein